MSKTLKLACSYVKYYKKQTLALFMGILLAVGLLTGIGSLLYSGRMANKERAREIGGDWHFRIAAEGNWYQEYLKSGDGKGYQIEKTGIVKIQQVTESPYEVVVAYGDAAYMEMMGRKAEQGHFPKEEGEVALDSYTLRNLELSDTLGSSVVIGEKSYTLCGILSDMENASDKDMTVFTADVEPAEENTFLYLKFKEGKKTYSQLNAFAKRFTINLKTARAARNNELAEYVGADSREQIFYIIKTGLTLPEGKFTYIWASLNQSINLLTKLILVCLGIFGGFVVYSLFQVSLMKRLSQYSVMQVLGMEGRSTFQVLFFELGMIFAAGFPIGCLVGNLTAKVLYRRAGAIFVNQKIGTSANGIHVRREEGETALASVNPGGFHVSFGTVFFAVCFFLLLLLFISYLLVRRMHKLTYFEMISQNTGLKKRSRKIYSLRHDDMTGILTKKFMFQRKGAFVSILLSLSIGGVTFLGTAYMTENTKINNEKTLRADDGLASDIQVYEDSDVLSDTIPQKTAEEIQQIPQISYAYPVSYLLGEIPFYGDTFHWPEFFPETAEEEGYFPDPQLMEKYNGQIVRDSASDYRLKVNVYGYEKEMLEQLSDYLLEGEVDPAAMELDNTVILKTLMDGQGNYDGISVKPGDFITLKVPKDVNVPQEALRFESSGEYYQEKEFRVAAVVSRTLAKTQNYIGDRGGSGLGIIMTNRQMQENFGLQGYNSISVGIKKGADAAKAADQVKKATSGISKCVVKDFTGQIARQNLYLKQKMLFFYGVGLVLLLISLLHIMNSMQYLVASRKQEFGILRAMGITDTGFGRMLIKEGVRYGIYSSVVMAVLYFMVQKLLYYFMVHVYLYLQPKGSIRFWPILGMAAVNVIVCVAAVYWAGREILRENVTEGLRGE